MAAKLKWPHEYAGGTSAAPGRNGYRSEATPFGYWTVDPVTYPNGRHRGYVAGFVNDKGAVPGGLHQRIGGWSKVFRSAREAKAAAANSYAGLLVAQGVQSNPRRRKKMGKSVAKKNPRKRMGAQARKDFAVRMRAARERAKAKKRIGIKRQIRRSGMGGSMDPNLPTKVLRAQRKALQARGMYQIGALTSAKKLAWHGGHGFTLLRGDALGFSSIAEAKARARNLPSGLVAGIFRSDVSPERARQFLLGKR